MMMARMSLCLPSAMKGAFFSIQQRILFVLECTEPNGGWLDGWISFRSLLLEKKTQYIA